MRVVALVSGGKDSCFNMMQCIAAGHEIVALANLQPETKDELDSYMYQTVGHGGIGMYAEAMCLPLYRRFTQGNAVTKDKEYLPIEGDEVEDLFLLLKEIKETVDFEGVAAGAILSDYQRIRVENVCTRLGCVSLAYLWRRNQTELLQEMIDCGINAIIVKTATLGLDPKIHLGQTIKEIQPHLLKSKEKYSINVCGEGGEYETFTLDCPIFRKALVIDESDIVIHSNDAFAPVGYLNLTKLHLVEKSVPLTKDVEHSSQIDLLEGIPVKNPFDYLAELAECNKADCCDGRDEICPKRKIEEDSNTLGVEPSTFSSSNNSSCSGAAGVEQELPDNNLKTEGQLISSLDISINELRHIPSDTVEPLDLPLTSKVTVNESGWCWIMGIGRKININENLLNNPMKVALEDLKENLLYRNLSLSDVVSMVLYISDMDDYVKYNEEYINFFTSQPPVRVCVQASLPANTPLIIEALAFSDKSDNMRSKNCMHVQGISHWCPANIGPYSQAIWVKDVIYVAGQIGLIPGNMKLVEGGPRMECKLSLRHMNRILRAVDNKVDIRYVVQGICYVTEPANIVRCREEWEKRTNNAIIEYIVVPRLPRDAKVEWQVWAHKHNSAFSYEETGCYIGSGVKVKIIRRWNYEDRISAIVCRAAICDQTGNIGKTELSQIVDYALSKLTQEAIEADKSLGCSFRVFYRISFVKPLDISETMNCHPTIAYSILPVTALAQGNTVLSICGVRHQ